MEGWVKDLVWFAAIVAALVVYGALTGVPWPIAVVSSYSMEPSLKMGDFILMTGANCRTVAPGDVVVYVARNPLWGGSWVIHRVAEKKSGNNCGLVTKGDNNLYPDQTAGEPLVSNNVVGKLALVVPYVGVFPMIVRPQGLGAYAAAAWLGRLAIFGAAVYGFYLYFKPQTRRKRKDVKAQRRSVYTSPLRVAPLSKFYKVHKTQLLPSSPTAALLRGITFASSSACLHRLRECIRRLLETSPLSLRRSEAKNLQCAATSAFAARPSEI